MDLINEKMHWWHGMTAIGAAGAAAFVAVSWENATMAACGLCIFGLGQWRDHRKTMEFMNPGGGIGAGVLYRLVYAPSVLGVALSVIGAGLGAMAAYRAFW